MPRAAALTGLAAEARILRRAGIPVAVTGGDVSRNAPAIAELLAGGAEALMSFGIAGGLDPRLRSGTLLLPKMVLEQGGRAYAATADWRHGIAKGLRAAGLAFDESDVVSTAAPVAEGADKAALFRQTGAAAVDLESAAVAASGRPFVVLRCVADPAVFDLPPAALVGLDPRGRPAVGRVLGSVVRQPGQVLELLRLAGYVHRAIRSLKEAVAAAGCGLTPDGLGG